MESPLTACARLFSWELSGSRLASVSAASRYQAIFPCPSTSFFTKWLVVSSFVIAISRISAPETVGRDSVWMKSYSPLPAVSAREESMV